MSRQLVLIESGEPDWRLDEHTVEVGRRGVAAAREVLRQATASKRDVPPPQRHRHAA